MGCMDRFLASCRKEGEQENVRRADKAVTMNGRLRNAEVTWRYETSRLAARSPAGSLFSPHFWFFSHLRERRTADPVNLWLSRLQIGADRGRRGLYDPAWGLVWVPGVFMAARASR